MSHKKNYTIADFRRFEFFFGRPYTQTEPCIIISGRMYDNRSYNNSGYLVKNIFYYQELFQAKRES